MEFQRIKRLPPYVFSIIDGMKMEARHRGEDIVDFGMGNPDLPTPPHVVAKLIEAAAKPANHRYSVSRGIYKLHGMSSSSCTNHRRITSVNSSTSFA